MDLLFHVRSSESDWDGCFREHTINLSFGLRQAYFNEDLEYSKLVRDHCSADQQDKWVEEDGARKIAGNVVRGEPSQQHPHKGGDLRVLNVFLKDKDTTRDVS